MRTRKLILGISALFVVAALNFAVFTRPANAEYQSCNGYFWVHCLNGSYIIRCSCSGGPTCYASWQGFCDDGGNY